MDFNTSNDNEAEVVTLRKRNLCKKKTKPLWNSFRDPQKEKFSGSANWNKFAIYLKIMKLFVYLLVFAMVLTSSVISKSSLVLIIAQISKGTLTKYCDILHPNNEIYALISEEQRISWIWAIIFAFTAPEIFTFLRALRIWFFKHVRTPCPSEVFMVSLMEIFHTIGLSILMFLILPNLNSMKVLMLMHCVCFLPALLSIRNESLLTRIEMNDSISALFSGFGINWKTLIIFMINGIAFCAQISGFIVWPLMENSIEFWMTPIVLILISCKWWENFISYLESIRYLKRLSDMRMNLTESRYYIYVFLSPIKVIIFVMTTFLIDGRHIYMYIENFISGWSEQTLILKEKSPIYTDHMTTNSTTNYGLEVKTSQNAHIFILLVHIFSSYFCYICAKFSCKIKIQEFSFSFPLSITGPVSLSLIMIITSLRESNVCFFHNYFPDYLAFKGVPFYDIFNYAIDEYIFVWVLWWLSQMWIVRHIWSPMNDKNASTEKLFISPWYTSFLIDQCITMNRRRLDQEKFVAYMDSVTFINPNGNQDKNDPQHRTNDYIPQLIVCATMWHEEEEEMMKFLKSIIRLDEDQCARRMARKYINRGTYDDEYYDLETNIFFDDAFVSDSKLCADPTNPPINKYVKTLIESIEAAMQNVYCAKMKLKTPTKIETPYGGRLIWTLPGGTKMIAHLKNNERIRNKKRWSQVMYMYYLLGYRIMELNITTKRKIVIAQNTFLLALDGDIDFQPSAVQLLIGRMKVDADLGAACGRIHPVGSGPMVWYQIFEYAIGHWLQKATEHVIGCVLCSPGCFSLFRGRALMEDSVMKKYTTIPKIARHYVQYDQGEDRWLCTLLLKQKFRVEYSAASDAFTHAPENFNEFFIQRRRWIPSTIANILDLLSDAKTIVRNNNSISMPYILYQAMIMVGTVLGPGTIFLMMIGSLVTVFNIDIWTSFLYNFVPVFGFMIMCYFLDQKYQLMAAFIISSFYCLVMMAVLIGIIIQVIEDGIMSPASLFFVAVAMQIVITGILHPQEAGALICGIVYYITIPSMYMLLLIFSIFNMNDVSWGTREKKPEKPSDEQNGKNRGIPNSKKQHKIYEWLSSLKSNKDDETGSIDFSFAGLFRCMICTHEKKNLAETQLLLITEHIIEMNTKLKTIERKLNGEETLPIWTKEEILNDTDIENEATEMNNLNINNSYLTGWLDDPLLSNFTIDYLSLHEKKFWDDLIKEYLYPLFKTDAEKREIRAKLRELRNIVVFGSVMINSLFVLVVLLLQINKNYLHIRWPFNAKDSIQFEDVTYEITIYRKYLELDPIGSCFVLFFGSILGVQFIAMLIHRFATISQILAATSLNWFCNPIHGSTDDAAEELRGNAVEIAKKSQRPKKIDEMDSDVEENEEPFRRNTLYKLHEQRNIENFVDWSDLQTNFERRFQKGKLRYEDIPLSRKSIRLIEQNRKSVLINRAP